MSLKLTHEEKIKIIEKRIKFADNSGIDSSKLAEILLSILEQRAGGEGGESNGSIGYP